MSRLITSIAVFMPILVACAGCAAHDQPAGPYLGQPLPGREPEIFAPGIVSLPDADELNAVFSEDGRLFLFSRRVGDALKVFECTQRADGTWTGPEMVGFSKTNIEWDEVDMWFTEDESALLYISNIPTEGFEPRSVNIWRVERTVDGWGQPEVLPAPINSDGNEIYPVPVDDGDLYFSSTRDGGFGGRDVYRAPAIEGGWADPENLGPVINTNANEGDIYVSPDESYLIVTSHRPGGLGKADMWISHRTADGGWGEPRNLGAPINSADHDFTPVISPDGRVFFFTRAGDVWWVEASAVLEPESSN